LIRGKYEVISDKQVRIVELPVGTWTDDYKQFIEDLIEGEKTSKKGSAKDTTKGDDKEEKKKKPACGIKDYTDMSTDTIVDITLTFAPGIITKLVAEEGDHGCNGLEKLLKLYTTRSTTNMHAFDENEKLVKFETVEDLISHYMQIRYDFYVKRKAYQLIALEQAAKVLSNKARFIGELLDSTLDLRKKKTSVVSALLKERTYDVIDEDEDYKYLVRLPMDSVTEENVAKINQERDKKLMELDILKKTSEKQLWLNELATLKTEYNSYIDNTRQTSDIVVKKKVKVVKK
jgi:DNA topoisomerase-2